MKYFNLLPFLFLISSCSSFKIDKEKLEEILAFEYEKLDSAPEDAIEFQCANNEFFYLRYLEENNAVWVILKDREYRLDKIESEDNAYANNTTNLDIKGRDAIIKVGSSVLYEDCKNIHKEEETSDDSSGVKTEVAKEKGEGNISNNIDIIPNDDPNLSQDKEQSDATESSWLQKLKFWKK